MLKRKTHPTLFLTGAAIALLPLKSAKGADSEMEALRKQVETLRQSVESLQQQLNRTSLAVPFAGGPISGTPAPGAAKNSDKNSENGSPAGAPRGHIPSSSNINPKISIAIDAVGSYSRERDNIRLTPRDAELVFEASVDPFARAYLVVNAGSELAPTDKQNPFGEVVLGLEEAAIETTALPFGLQVKAGQFFADFTRLGKVHPHDLPFVDHPPVIETLVGGETKGRGVELNWVPPIGKYVRFTLGVVDNLGAERSSLAGADSSGGSTAIFRASETRGFGSLTYYGRAASIFELTDSMFLHLGANTLRGRDEGTRTLWGGDAKLVWQRPGGDEAEVGGELLSGRQTGNLSYPLNGMEEAAATGNGAYAYAQYRIGKSWTPGVRLDYLRTRTLAEADSTGGTTPDSIESSEETRRALSGYLGYQFSEYQRLRLQFSYIRSNTAIAGESKHDLQAFFQWTILLGNHQHSFKP